MNDERDERDERLFAVALAELANDRGAPDVRAAVAARLRARPSTRRRWLAAAAMLWALAVVVTTFASRPQVAGRAPCTGTLRDASGAGIAGAAITCVQEHSQVLGGEPDRATAVTDAAGQFSLQLLRGSPYLVWAIGVADAKGERWLARPSMTAAAGKTIELRAQQRGAPRRVDLRGVSAWQADGPLALRVLVGGVYAFAADVPLPGDIALPLGPWPDGDATVALVDGRGGVVQRQWLPATATAIEFTPPRAIAIDVVDAKGASVADAEICVPDETAEELNPVDPLATQGVARWRVAARTDAKGHALARVPWRAGNGENYVTLAARHQGRWSPFAGCVGEDAIGAGLPVGDAALQLVLQEPSVARGDLGWIAPARVQAMALLVTGPLEIGPMARKGFFGSWTTLLPVAPTEAAVAVELPFAQCGTSLRLRLAAIGEQAPRRLAVQQGGARALPTVAADKLRRTTVTIVDAGGAPVPFAQFAVTVPGAAWRDWLDRGVADERGEVQVSVGPGKWLLVALDRERLGIARLGTTDAPDTVRIRLEPLPVARLRVRDEAGRPVVGARFASTMSWSEPPVEEERKQTIEALSRAQVRIARSDVDGLLLVPLAGVEFTGLTVQAGERKGSVPKLVAGDEPIDVVVR